ncbi:MAG: hypothetical protein IJO62_00950 [Clostridia bacterium]|nr:hypothetical protein [Clostridia bacterium]
MKKIIVLFSVVFIFAMLTSCNQKSEIAALVYGEEITVDFVQNKAAYSKEVYDKNVEFINNSDFDVVNDKAEALEKLSKPKTYDEVLKDEIWRIVLLKEAERKEIKVDFAECKKQAEENYEVFMSIKKEDEQNYQSVQEIKNYIKENRLSKNEYINQLANSYYNNSLINGLKRDFMKNGYVFKDGAPTFDEQFNEYTKQLVKDAKVKYYD